MVLDDATSEIYYAQLVEAECTRTVMAALREVIETKGVFCSLYSDRAGHFFVTPKRGERVDLTRPTQVGRALAGTRDADDPGLFAAGAGADGTQLRHLAGTPAAGAATARNYRSSSKPMSSCATSTLPSSTSKFAVRRRRKARRLCAAAQDLDWIFSVQHERTVNQTTRS